MKKLSIITINYNNRDGLRKTIESVVAQTTRDFEYIVIDGGSTDGSVDVIREYADHIDYWVSEPDGGIYNAMNKGVRAASGEYCIFMNSGDYFYSADVIAEFFKSDPTADIILGKTAIDRDGKISVSRPVTDAITFFRLYQAGIIHQATFIRTLLMSQMPYDEHFKICSDWKFFLNALVVNNCSFATTDIIVVFYDTMGISGTQKELMNKERNEILSELAFPQRILADYAILNSDIMELAKELSPYVGLRKFICKTAIRSVRVYKIIPHAINPRAVMRRCAESLVNYFGKINNIFCNALNDNTITPPIIC